MKFSKHIDGAALPTWDWCGLRHWAELSLVVGSVLRVPRWVVSVACGSISFCVCRGKAATATLTATRDYELLQKLSTFQKASVLATFTCILWSHESPWLLDITWYYLMLLGFVFAPKKAIAQHLRWQGKRWEKRWEGQVKSVKSGCDIFIQSAITIFGIFFSRHNSKRPPPPQFM